MLQPSIQKNDNQAKWLIGIASVTVFVAVAVLSKVKLAINLGFNVHIFATVNAYINAVVSILLVAALIAVRQKKYVLHKNIMLTAIIFSSVFLISYICHHLLAAETKFGGQGALKYVYYFILATHIILAAIILPFILFTAYRALTGEWLMHKKMARYTWPLWLYVSITGVLVYVLISPYYS
jgi:putative membrane protein